MLTAWDALSASIVEEAGADVVLVGDSLAMVSLGHTTTLPVTLEQMLLSTQAVCRGLSKPQSEKPLVIKHSSAGGVKLESAEPEVVQVIERLVRMGIPVMGHLGLTPQSVHQLGYRRQAKDPVSQERLCLQAADLEKAGCFAIVLEHVPEVLAGRMRRDLEIPVIGIGAGQDCDGQVSVTADLLGLTPRQPPFSQARLDGRALGIQALRSWLEEQRQPAADPTTARPQPGSDC